MEFSIKQGSPEKLRSACVMVGVFDGGKLTDAAEVLDKSARHYISEIIARGDMNGKAGTTLLLHKVPNTACERVLLIGLGKRAELDARQYRNCLRSAMMALHATTAKDALLYLAELPVKGRDSAWCINQAVLAAFETSYRADQLKSKADKEKHPLKKIQFGLLTAKPNAAACTRAASSSSRARAARPRSR